jgi:hypothetical protein
MARRSGGGQSVAAQSAEVEQHTRLVTLCPAVSMRERIIGMLTDAGAEVTGTSIDVGPDGQMIENTHVEFRPVAAELRLVGVSWAGYAGASVTGTADNGRCSRMSHSRASIQLIAAHGGEPPGTD